MSGPLDIDGLRVVLEGAVFVVVEKPAGLLSVPGKGADKADCVAARVAAAFPRATGPLIVHRLDMDTSGLMVLGLSPGAQRALSAQFEARTVEKRYTALVDGLVLHAREGVIDLPMRLDPAHRPFQVIDLYAGRGARTVWRVLAHETDRTRLALAPETGRSHQLRVHTATPRDRGGLGHGIVGDVLYGSGYTGPEPDRLGRTAPGDRMMLHACALAFDDPETGRRIRVESEPEF